MIGPTGRLRIVVVACLAAGCGTDRQAARPEESGAPSAAAAPPKSTISYDEARPIIDALRSQLPADLQELARQPLQAAWPGWIARHDAGIRARLARGDEDSVVNFWMYGTSFTSSPRATERNITTLGDQDKAENLLLERLDDLIAGMSRPDANERLQFAREVIRRQGIDLSTAAGQEKARVYLAELRNRMVAENARHRAAARSAGRQANSVAASREYGSIYRDRGLSSDTSIAADFALDRAIAVLESEGRLGKGRVRRVAVVGPGLDFTDKAEGYDFYPPQTIQPFALIDSLARHHLARRDELRLTTFDLSPRVNQHLEAARRRAAGGEAYVLQLPLATDDPSHEWHPDLVAYWTHFGEAIGSGAQPLPPPPGAGEMRVRALRIPSALVATMTPVDLNIVVERLQPLPDDERFDLIVATNILVYYDAFDQALALANIAKMLRPGGFLVTNYVVSPRAPMEPAASLVVPVFWDRQRNGDTMFGYQRR